MSDIDFGDLVWRPGWLPSNGSEGMDFMWQWCQFCKNDAAARRGDFEHGCPLIVRSLSREQLDEWQTTKVDFDGRPGFLQRCTAFDRELPDPPGWTISAEQLLVSNRIAKEDAR